MEPLNSEPLKLLAIFPHPDDETLGCGGTLAKYSAEGVETYLICATRGQRGWPQPDQPSPGLDELGRMRELELGSAAAALGLHEVTLLDCLDGDVDQADPHEMIQTLTAHIRRIRPQVVLTFGPDGIYGHPDHIAISQFTGAALVSAADPSYLASGGPAPHRTSKLYYMADFKKKSDIIQEAIGTLNITVDGVVRSHFGWDEWAITTRIDVADYFDQTWRAILCHKSQLPGLGQLLHQPRSTLLKLFGEGTFIRVFSMVNSGRTIETNLFTGLRAS